MTCTRLRESVLLWSILLALGRVLLGVPASAAESLEFPYYVQEPKENSERGGAVGGFGESYKDFLHRYFHPTTSYPQHRQPSHYTTTTALVEDGGEDEELSFFPTVKRLGSEFLGKRTYYSVPIQHLIWGPSLEKRRMRSDAAGNKRRLGSEFLGKRSGPFQLGLKEESERDFLKAMLPFRFTSKYEGELSPETEERILAHEGYHRIRRAIGPEFEGKTEDGINQWEPSQELDPYSSEDKPETGADSMEKRMGSEFPGKRMGSEFLGKRRLGSELLGKRMGSEFLGKRMGSEFLGKRMGSEFLGKRMGSEFLGKRMGSEFLGKRMGSEFLGKRMGSEFLGKRMGSEFLGKRRLGSELLGKRMGSEFLGKRMGSEFLGKRMGSEFLGKRMGSEFLGKRMGSEFLGKRRLGSELLGKRMGSEFLGKRKLGSELLGKRSELSEGEESEQRNSTSSDRQSET